MRDIVFVGPGNIAGNAMYIAKALRLVGISAVSYSYQSHPFGYKCDHDGILFKNPFSEDRRRNLLYKFIYNKYSIRTIWLIQRVLTFLNALIFHRIFIFISHETFFRNNRDLALLKFFRKEIAFLFVGCPERDPCDPLNKSDGGFCSFCESRDMQKYLNCYKGDLKEKKIEYISNHARIIFSNRDTVSFIRDKSKVRKYYCISDIKVTRQAIEEKFNSATKPVICHFPSNKNLKSTDSVLKAIENIKMHGESFDFINERVSNQEVRERLDRTHILIDQFSIGPGLLGVEGMASGCVVISRTSKWFREDFPDLPVISCEQEELANVLAELMSDPGRMLDIALKSFEYFNKYHSLDVMGNYCKNCLGIK